MKLYHGSQEELVEPRFGLGQDHHDFGRGFYLTDAEGLAKEWSELMRHRDADESAAYRRRAPLFIEKFGVKDADDYDVMVGWRADASYFYIVKAFVRDRGDVYLATLCPKELMAYYRNEDSPEIKAGEPLRGFAPNWMGQFYARYQWEKGCPSSDIVDDIPPEWLNAAYPGLHDLDLGLAVEKVWKAAGGSRGSGTGDCAGVRTEMI